MVFVDGHKRYIEGIVRILDAFAKQSGLKISIKKDTIYLVGCTDQSRENLLFDFPFAIGQLPVRYLGIPLMTKRVTEADYMPLIERIKQKKMRSWTVRHLLYAGQAAFSF